MKECDCVSLYLPRLIVAVGFRSAPVALPRQRSSAKLTRAQPFGDSDHQLSAFFFGGGGMRGDVTPGGPSIPALLGMCPAPQNYFLLLPPWKRERSHIASSLLLTFNRICRLWNPVWFDGVPNGLIKANCLFISSFSV